MTAPSFRYWDSVQPGSFLKHDWENPSRAWATDKAIGEAVKADGTVLEVGPGPGVDYERHFREAVKSFAIRYSAYEGSQTLQDALQRRFPESTWHWRPLHMLPPQSAAVIYARHVLEHQPALEPALTTLLNAARVAVVLTWYRPPADHAFGEVWEDVPCNTWNRTEVLRSVKAAGFKLSTKKLFPSGDEAWILRRK